MTTSNSSPEKLLDQAKRIVVELKRFNWPVGKIDVTFGIVMDDKIIRMTMLKDTVESLSSADIEKIILNYMDGSAGL